MRNTALPPGPGQTTGRNCGPYLTCQKDPQGPLDSSVPQLSLCTLIRVPSPEPQSSGPFLLISQAGLMDKLGSISRAAIDVSTCRHSFVHRKHIVRVKKNQTSKADISERGEKRDTDASWSSSQALPGAQLQLCLWFP